jgi:hypothetical protein
MFKRFECGCIGFVTYGTELGAKHVWLVKACAGSRDEPPVGLCRRDSLQEKHSVKLTDAEVDALLGELAELVNAGNRLVELRMAFVAAGLTSREV